MNIAERPTNTMLSLLRHRRSVAPPLLTSPGPSAEEIEQLLTIAARVPDHGKLAPWRFSSSAARPANGPGEIIAATYRQDNADATEAQIEFERRRLASAPLVVAVISRAAPHPKIPEWEQQLSAGAVCMNLVVAANALGFATSWLTQWYAYDRRVLDALGLAAHEKIAGFVHMGAASAPQPDRARPELADIVTYF